MLSGYSVKQCGFEVLFLRQKEREAVSLGHSNVDLTVYHDTSVEGMKTKEVNS